MGIWALPFGIPLIFIGWANLGIGLDSVPSFLAGLGGDIFDPIAGIGIFMAFGPALWLAGIVMIVGALESLYSAFSAIFASINELPVRELSLDAIMVVLVVGLAAALSVLSYDIASEMFIR